MPYEKSLDTYRIPSYIYKEDLALITYNGWYAIKPNETKLCIFNIYV